MEAAPRSTGTMWRSTDIRAPTSTLGAGAAADLGGMSSPAPLAAESRSLGKRRLGRDADAREPYDDVAEDHEEARLRHREHLAAFHHAAARPGSRAPLHRRDSVHHFLRGRELVRHATNLTARPGVRDFASDGGVGAGVIPIVPPTTGVGSPPFVVRFCQETRGCALLAVADEEGTVTLADTSRRLPGPASAEYDFRPEAQWVAHDNAIFDVAWCRGDARMLTASGDQTVRLWDVETMVPHRTFRGHHGSVKAVAVQPESGGDVFASCGRDGAIALWDARAVSRARGDAGEPEARPVAAVERAHEDARLMRGKTKTKTKTKTAKSGASVSSAAFAHDGQVLLSAGAADGLVKLWDVRRLRRDCEVAVMADADPGASAGNREDLWGNAVAQPSRPRRGITSLALAPNGSSRVAASYSDSHIAVFDHNAPSAGPACHLRAPGHMPFKTSFYVKTAFSPCGTHSPRARATRTCTCGTWTARGTPAALAGHAGEVSAVDWSPAAFGCLASCADDGVARVWAVDRGGSGEVEPRQTDDETEDERRRRASRDDDKPERSRFFFGATPTEPRARDASSPPASLRTPAFSRERSIQAYFSPQESL